MAKSFSATLQGKKFEFVPCKYEDYARYIASELPGPSAMRELAHACLKDREAVDELASVLRNKPAAVKPIADKIEELSGGGELMTEDGDKAVMWRGVRFSAPTYEWEELEEKAENATPEEKTESVRELLLRLSDDKTLAAQLFEDLPFAVSQLYYRLANMAGRSVQIEMGKD